jgi:hypothetical protein
MKFEERLDKAIQRGHRSGQVRAEVEAQRALNEKELQRLHSQYRLEVSEHIERCLQQLIDRFPGFRSETIVDERGWGTAISRDDLRLKPPRRAAKSCFSRLEVVIRPANAALVLELVAKGTVCNREVFNRSNYQQLAEVDITSFLETIDLWVLEFAERYAAER